MNRKLFNIKGIELIKELSNDDHNIFTINEARQFAPKVNLSPSYLLETLHYLVASGWIVRIKRGLYSISIDTPGSLSLHEYAIAMTLVEPATISHWSAMHHHGFSEQIPNTVFVTTTSRNYPRNPHKKSKKLRLSEFMVGKQLYKFIHIKSENYFGIETIWVNESKINITNKERTLIDGLMMPRYCGNFAEVMHALVQNINKLDIDQLINYAIQINPATAKRLGWILEEFNLVSSDKLNILNEIPIKGYRSLDPSEKAKGKYNAKWMVRVNL